MEKGRMMIRPYIGFYGGYKMGVAVVVFEFDLKF
jgi:hypothetical protein